jgi:hypothetical protein
MGGCVDSARVTNSPRQPRRATAGDPIEWALAIAFVVVAGIVLVALWKAI